MKILHISFTFAFGGIETMLVNIANAQVEMGHKVRIIIVERNSIEPTLKAKLDKRIKLYCANRRANSKDIMALFRLNWFIETFSPDAIHIHGANLYRFILDPRFKRITNGTLHALPSAGNTIAIEKIPKEFAISEAVRRELLAYKGVDAIINPNGICTKLVKVRTTIEYNGKLKIVCVSRLSHEFKGQHILIGAAAELVKMRYTEFTIHFIGDGSSRGYLESLVKKLNVESYISFLGARSQEYIFEHLMDYDLFVQPSIFEGFGNTVIEAMAAKLPVIVSSGQGPEEVIAHGKYGYIFENGNIINCAEAISIFLRKENNMEQIEKGYQHVINFYDVRNTAARYVEQYLHR